MSAALVCRDTAKRFDLSTPIWRSPAVAPVDSTTPAGLLDIDWPIDASTFPRDKIAARPATMWRYREAIPIPAGCEVSLGEGMTPLLDVPTSVLKASGAAPTSSGATHASPNQRWMLKLDTLHPSGSYKDRGVSVMVSQCRHLGLSHIVEDSSGNAGSSFALYCAAANIACDIYVPESTSPAKLTQVLTSGAKLIRVPGDRQATSDAIWDAAQCHYYVSHAWNPFFFHGTKTLAFEVCEQLGWRAPDAIVIPTGNGTLLLGCWIGFDELRRAGVIDRVPRLIAVQAQNCSPLAGSQAHSPTIAEGIAIPRPIRREQCLEAIRTTGGRVVTVSESGMIASLRAAIRAGLYIEPTCASSLAAMAQLSDIEGTIVLAATGHGLKTNDTIAKLLA
jgi:threonine synthase